MRLLFLTSHSGTRGPPAAWQSTTRRSPSVMPPLTDLVPARAGPLGTALRLDAPQLTEMSVYRTVWTRIKPSLKTKVSMPSSTLFVAA